MHAYGWSYDPNSGNSGRMPIRARQEQDAHRELCKQISRLEDEAERLRYSGELTTEREQSIRERMNLAREEYEELFGEVVRD